MEEQHLVEIQLERQIPRPADQSAVVVVDDQMDGHRSERNLLEQEKSEDPQ